MVSKVLYIEGTKDDTNGDLREGFRFLLEQKLKGKMPRLVMGNGKDETVGYFSNERLNAKYKHRSLLIDSDKAESKEEREKREKDSATVYFMVQEMETWFFSQPQILDEVFGIKVSAKITNADITSINDPSDKLMAWTQGCKMPYHKVHHGVKLLKQLNLAELEQKFPDIKRLVKSLEN